MHKAAGKLPDWLVDLYENKSSDDETPRKAKSDIVNTILKKNKKGGYDMDLDNHKFYEAKTKFQVKTSTAGTRGLQMLTFIASVFTGNKEAFQAAYDAGEISKVHSNGLDFYSHKVENTDLVKGTTHEGKISADMLCMWCVADVVAYVLDCFLVAMLVA